MYKKIVAVSLSFVMFLASFSLASGKTIMAAPDAFEPNDTYLTATIALPNYSYSNLNLSAGDKDWFKFHLTMGQYIIQTNTSNTAVDPDLYIYDGAYTGVEAPIVALPNNGGDINPYFVLDVPTEADYYFAFNGANPLADYASVGTYGFSVTYQAYLTPTPLPSATPIIGVSDIYEPNNNFPPPALSYINFNSAINNLTITANDHDIFYSVLAKGKYAVIITSTSDQMDPEIKLYDANFNHILTSSNNGGTSLDPAFYFDVPADNSTYYFEIYGNIPSIDYSQFGTYSITLDYVPVNGVLAEDAYEPNDTIDQARLVGYQTTITGLSLYSYRTVPDIDVFRLVAPRDMDLSCSATADNSMLNLAMKAHIEGRNDMGGYRTEDEDNYIGVNPKIAIHNLESGVPIIFYVYNENPSTYQDVAGITYTFKCVNGLGIPEPTATPTSLYTATRTPITYITYAPGTGVIGGQGYYGYGTPVPTVTGTPSVLNFKARPSGGGYGAPTQVVPKVDEFVQINFLVYADTNKNGMVDFDEYIKNLNIYLIDSATNTPSNVLTTNEQGTVSVSLSKSEMNKTRYRIPLLNLGGKLEETVTVKVASILTSSVLP